MYDKIKKVFIYICISIFIFFSGYITREFKYRKSVSNNTQESEQYRKQSEVIGKTITNLQADNSKQSNIISGIASNERTAESGIQQTLETNIGTAENISAIRSAVSNIRKEN